MKLPDFNAELSLYSDRVSYYSAGRASGFVGALQPAVSSSCRQVCQGDPDCMQCCMCIRRGGDPSQCCF